MNIIRPAASAEIVLQSPTHIRIKFIEAKIKRCGHGSKLLQDICDMADRTKRDVSLLPVVNSGMSLHKLRVWYSCFGFVDFECGMIRRVQK